MRAAISAQGEGSLEAIDRMIAEQVNKRKKLMQSIVEQGETEESHIADFAMIANAINVLRLQKAEVEQDTLRQENTEARLAAMRERLRSMDISLETYDDRLVWQMVESVKVLSREKVQIRFKVGIEIGMELTQE